jgi:ABC-type tungstate transport system substrate-binding protein
MASPESSELLHAIIAAERRFEAIAGAAVNLAGEIRDQARVLNAKIDALETSTRRDVA